MMTIIQSIFLRKDKKEFEQSDALAAPLIVSILSKICAVNNSSLTDLAHSTLLANFDVVKWIISLLKLDNWIY